MNLWNTLIFIIGTVYEIDGSYFFTDKVPMGTDSLYYIRVAIITIIEYNFLIMKMVMQWNFKV